MRHNHIRLWWQKPRKVTEPEQDRTVSFLELFYDLSYVVLIAELAHSLVGHFTLDGLWAFIALFAMTYLAWMNGSYYHELHGNNDIRTRVVTFLQMIALAGMAVFAHNAFGSGYQGFAISYSIFLAIITVLWWRTGVHDPEHAPMSNPYAAGFLVTTLAFFASAFVQPSIGYYFWIVGLVFSLLLPLILVRPQRRLDKRQLEAAQRISPSLVERFGLLTIIMLGEVIVAVVVGVAGHHHMDASVIIIGVLGMLVAFSLWWVYFDFVSHRLPQQTQAKRFGWIYLHLPVTMAITLTGVGVLIALEEVGHMLTDAQRWLLVGPVGVLLLCVAILIHIIQIPDAQREINAKGQQKAVIAGLIILSLGFFEINTTILLGIMTVLMLAPVWAAVRMWIRREHLKHS